MEIQFQALLGGVLIGIAVSLMLLFNGRVTGVSGIFGAALFEPKKGDWIWRWSFLLGLILGGVLFQILDPLVFGPLSSELWMVIPAGFLVGLGTAMGSGCTSGHGVCGFSRLSPRSLVATFCFIGSGVFTVFIFRALGVIP